MRIDLKFYSLRVNLWWYSVLSVLNQPTLLTCCHSCASSVINQVFIHCSLAHTRFQIVINSPCLIYGKLTCCVSLALRFCATPLDVVLHAAVWHLAVEGVFHLVPFMSWLKGFHAIAALARVSSLCRFPSADFLLQDLAASSLQTATVANSVLIYVCWDCSCYVLLGITGSSARDLLLTLFVISQVALWSAGTAAEQRAYHVSFSVGLTSFILRFADLFWCTTLPGNVLYLSFLLRLLCNWIC